MRTTSLHIRALAAGAALLIAALPSALQADDELFYLPDMEAEIFATDKIDFGKRREIDRNELVTALVRVASDFDEDNGGVPAELRSNALGIAGRIDPESRSFKETFEQLKANAKAWGAGNTNKSRLVGNIYRGVRHLMVDENNKDNRICAAYCIDVALRLDPAHEYADRLGDFRDKLQADDIELKWEELKGKAVIRDDGDWNPWAGRGTMEAREEAMKGGEGKSFATKQSSVIGLVVVTLGGGKHAGAAREIIATALPEDNVKGIKFKIDQEVGDMMGNSLKSIRDYLRVLHEGTDRVPDGYEVNIVFQDRDQPVDGPSAGVAMFLMLDALFTGNLLDPKFACTGGITPNGKCTTIGGVAAKIRGATNRHCNIVGVPEGNAGGVNDIFVLNGLAPLLDIQIFTMADVEQARALALQEKSEEVNAVLEDFIKVANVIRDKGEEMLKNSQVQQKLEGVLEKMPNHMSAKVLLDLARGKAHDKLSGGGSFHEIDSRASGLFSRVQMMVLRERFHEGKVARDDAADALKELEEISGKVDPRFDEYIKAAIDLSKLVQGGIEDGEEEFIKELKTKWQSIQNTRKKLSEDPALREEIMG